jgi:hypothetical protein
MAKNRLESTKKQEFFNLNPMFLGKIVASLKA